MPEDYPAQGLGGHSDLIADLGWDVWPNSVELRVWWPGGTVIPHGSIAVDKQVNIAP